MVSPGLASEARLAFQHHRGGGPYTRAVSQRLGSVVAALVARLRWTPDALTTTNLVIGVAAASVVAASPQVLNALVAAVLWQIAYACDCADGQLARWKGLSTAHGKAYDVLCDFVVQICLVTVVLARSSYDSPNLLVPVAGLFLLGTVFAALADQHLPRPALRESTNGGRQGLGFAVVLVSRACRDYGLVALTIGVALCFHSEVPLAVLGLAGLLNVVSTVARFAPVLSFRTPVPGSAHIDPQPTVARSAR